MLDLRKQLRDALSEINAAKFSGRKAMSASKGSTLCSTDPLPSFDTSIAADVRGRKLFDNMKRDAVSSLSISSNMNERLSMSRSVTGLARSNSFMSQTISSERSVVSHSPSKAQTTGSNPPASYGSSAHWILSFRSELQAAIDTDAIRSLSLKECRDAIASLYDTKDSANARMVARSKSVGDSSLSYALPGTPPVLHVDTMEMHVYRTMEKKYGLRSLAVEHAAMLLTAVRLYSDQESDVGLFYRIFCNDVEEEFRAVQEELKKSIRDLMIVSLMNRLLHSVD